MMAARADIPVDRLDDALLVSDAVAARAGAYTTDGRVTVKVSTWSDALELAVGPLREGGAEGLLDDSVLPGVGNVVERVASGVRIDQDPDTGTPALVVRIGFEASL
jgi:serine/threonine-protein kinase RsbW